MDVHTSLDDTSATAPTIHQLIGSVTQEAMPTCHNSSSSHAVFNGLIQVLPFKNMVLSMATVSLKVSSSFQTNHRVSVYVSPLEASYVKDL